jgi:hypothetical protein
VPDVRNAIVEVPVACWDVAPVGQLVAQQSEGLEPPLQVGQLERPLMAAAVVVPLARRAGNAWRIEQLAELPAYPPRLRSA